MAETAKNKENDKKSGLLKRQNENYDSVLDPERPKHGRLENRNIYEQEYSNDRL